MRRRMFMRTTAAAVLGSVLPSDGRAAGSSSRDQQCAADEFVWKQMLAPPNHILTLNGHTDTVPDIVGRLGAPIGLAIFTEGNHFPVLLGDEIIEPFRAWAHGKPPYVRLNLENIVIVTLPQPMIVAMIREKGIELGNLTLEVSRRSGFYPDVVMGGLAPLTELHKAGVVGTEAHVFARNRGLSLLVRAGNPLTIHSIENLKRPDVRIIMASADEPGARSQYISALKAMLGTEATESILVRETGMFPGRLGIQHRDVLHALAAREAEVGIIFHHLARYFANAYPQVCAMVTVPGAEQFSSTIAMVSAIDPLRAKAANAFAEYFLSVARTVYPRYGFVSMTDAEYGVPLTLR
jgi:hypothetical protein